MESLIQTLLSQITEIPSVQIIVPYVPQFVVYANTLTIPGAEKQATVLRGLHELTLALRQADKITMDLQTELDQFIDITVPSIIEGILAVAADRVELKVPTTVAEVVPKVNCLFAFIQSILRMAGKSKEAKAVADIATVVKSAVPSEIIEDGGIVIKIDEPLEESKVEDKTDEHKDKEVKEPNEPETVV